MAIKDQKGHWLDEHGDYVRPKYVSMAERAWDSMVTKIATRARAVSLALQDLRTLAETVIREHMEAVVDAAERDAGVAIPWKEGQANLTFYDFARCTRVEVQSSSMVAFDGSVAVAMQAISACVTRWGATADQRLVTLVNGLMAEAASGNRVAVNSLLRLRSYKFHDAGWDQAMRLIADALVVISRKQHIKYLPSGY